MPVSSTFKGVLNMKPAKANVGLKFVVLERGRTFSDTIIAIYRQNAKDGEAPLWTGSRKEHLQNELEKLLGK
jgi:hypothetical protein